MSAPADPSEPALPAVVPDFFTLPDGRQIHFRHLKPSDQEAIAEAYRTASPRTLEHRFFRALRAVPPDELHRMLHFDRRQELCIVGFLRQAGRERIVCGARYIRRPDPTVAEAALTVHDDFQGLGLGTFLLERLIGLGRAEGIRRFVADILPDNQPMLRIVRRLAPARNSRFEGGVVHVEFDLVS